MIPDVDIDKFRGSLIKTGESIKGKANEIDMGKQSRVHSPKFDQISALKCVRGLTRATWKNVSKIDMGKKLKAKFLQICDCFDQICAPCLLN